MPASPLTPHAPAPTESGGMGGEGIQQGMSRIWYEGGKQGMTRTWYQIESQKRFFISATSISSYWHIFCIELSPRYGQCERQFFRSFLHQYITLNKDRPEIPRRCGYDTEERKAVWLTITMHLVPHHPFKINRAHDNPKLVLTRNRTVPNHQILCDHMNNHKSHG